MAAWVIWLLAAGFLFVVEMLTLTFYLLWLGVGALAGAIAALALPGSFLAQVLVACLTALVLTIYSKRISGKVRIGRGYQDAVDTLVGRQAVVIQDISKEGNGIVKVGGDLWSAKADEPIGKGETVTIVQRSSTIVHVQKGREGK
ncbi:NfeD family protein [Ectobacillus ponti]|uniref:NfeD family protein n=1 Tax=Ectobacillus ponti TaxID=2961894 RepID=A0AA41X850_9BACI|nr:NfeD family protein [Ectobacillus ponti]MCP8968913.1 NfeD family protein [Ectobacillus ponti]